VRYTASTFIRPDAVRFRHQLVNFDRDWVEAGSQRFVQYSYIPPGEYTLKILAANSDGVWSPEGVSLPIRVRPYWWQRTWSRAAAVLIGLTLLWAGYQRRVSALNRRRADQDAFARRLLESQEAERKRIAYELHDGIGQTLVVIKNRALLGIDAGGDPGLLTHLTEISTAAGGAIDEVRKVAYGLRPYQLDRLGVTRALQSLVEQTAAASGLALTADIDELEGMLTKNDEVNVYRIVQEAVNNMVRHARARSGRVAVRVGEHEIDIRIEDDGVGFDPAAQAAGLGLAGIAERARILGGGMTVRSSPGQGTAVSVSIPVKRKG
jgi:signal transduction histidine kinase